MARLRLIAIALGAALASAGAAADTVTDQLDAARNAYAAGDYQGAVDALNFTIAALQQKITQSQLQIFPAPLAGWQADPAQSEAAGLASMITGTTLSRRYFRPDGAEVTLRLMANSPLLPVLTMFLSSPFMMQADPNTQAYSVQGQRGMIKQTEHGGVEATLMVGNNILVQAEGSAAAGQQAVQDYLGALDMTTVTKAFSPQPGGGLVIPGVPSAPGAPPAPQPGPQPAPVPAQPQV
jgi:hypothetical protein